MGMASCPMQQKNKNVINVFIEKYPIGLDVTIPYSAQIIQLMIPIFSLEFLSIGQSFNYIEKHIKVFTLFLCEFHIFFESSGELDRVLHTSRASLRFLIEE